jgi:hypothetical protein
MPPPSSVTRIRHPGSATCSATLAILDHMSPGPVTTKRSATMISSPLSTSKSYGTATLRALFWMAAFRPAACFSRARVVSATRRKSRSDRWLRDWLRGRVRRVSRNDCQRPIHLRQGTASAIATAIGLALRFKATPNPDVFLLQAVEPLPRSSPEHFDAHRRCPKQLEDVDCSRIGLLGRTRMPVRWVPCIVALGRIPQHGASSR